VLEKGDAKAALTYLRPASHTLPDDPVVQYHLAAALKETGKSDEARAMLEKLLQSDAAFDGRDGAKQLLSELTHQ
jgi:cellulose synthase operon protein C